MKLRAIDKQSKSKVIISVKAGSQGQIHCEVHTVLLNGEQVHHDREKQREAIRKISPQIADVLALEGVNPSTGESWGDALEYWFKQAEKFIGTDPVTIEDKREELQSIIADLKASDLLILSGKSLPQYAIDKLNEAIKDPKYVNVEKLKAYTVAVVNKVTYIFASKMLMNKVDKFFDQLQQAQKLKKLIESFSHGLPSRSEVWTLDRLSEKLNGYPKNLLMPVFFLTGDEKQEQIDAIKQGIYSARLNKWAKLQKELNIVL